MTQKPRISRIMMQWLLTCVVGAFTVMAAISYFTNTHLSRQSTNHLLRNSIEDVLNELQENDEHALMQMLDQLCEAIEDSAQWAQVNAAYLYKLGKPYHVSELFVANAEGFIETGTIPSLIRFDYASTEQSREFLRLLDPNGDKYFLQEMRLRGIDNEPFRYVGRRFDHHPGFFQMGFDADLYYKNVVDDLLTGCTRHRRIGDAGSIFIFDNSGTIISAPSTFEGRNIADFGLDLRELREHPLDQLFQTEVQGTDYYMHHCTYQLRYHILAIQSTSEATLTRDTAVKLSSLIVFLTFALLFFQIYWLIRRVVVRNIDRINGSLSVITDGNLNEEVNVRDTVEFDDLSTDINKTVDRLKGYIHEAETRLDADLMLAKAIQMSSLPNSFPAFPNHTEFDIFASTDPAKEVGGDFYDFYFVGPDKLAIAIADVSGKGIPAAMFMMRGKSTLKNTASNGTNLEEVFNLANAHLCKNNDTTTFITIWMAFINIRTGEVEYINAGHNAPLIYHTNGGYEYLTDEHPCLPIGTIEEYTYHSQHLTLAPDDKIFLYTDGVTEAENPSSQLYGDDRLRETLNAMPTDVLNDPTTTCQHLLNSIRAFANGAEQSDDITMLNFQLR